MKTFLFDLDGTLIDTAPDIAEALFLTMDDFQLPRPDVVSVISWIGGGARVLVQQALANLQEKQQQSIGIDDFHRCFLGYYRQTNGKLCRPYPGVADTLEKLHRLNLPIACVTNKPEELASEVLAHCKLKHHFSYLIGGDTLATAKPDAAPILHAIENLGASQSETWMVGDSATDVYAARAAGVRSAWVSYGYHQGESEASLRPDIALDQFHQVLTLAEI